MTNEELLAHSANFEKKTVEREAIVDLFNSQKKPSRKSMIKALKKVGRSNEDANALTEIYYQIAYALANEIPYQHALCETAQEPEGGLTAGRLPPDYT